MNPVNPSLPRSTNTGHGILAANKPLIVPMQLKISQLRFKGIMVLSVCKYGGITLCFKNDPIDSVAVNSSFDSVPNVKEFLQTEIEGQLRRIFSEAIPEMMHRISTEMSLLRRSSRSHERRWPAFLSETPVSSPTPEPSASPVSSPSISRRSSFSTVAYSPTLSTASSNASLSSMDSTDSYFPNPDYIPVLLLPECNSLTARLAKLMSANQTLLPPLVGPDHVKHRASLYGSPARKRRSAPSRLNSVTHMEMDVF